MSNGHFQLAKYLAREKEISVDEARTVCEERRNFKKYFFREVNTNENCREEWSGGNERDVNGKGNI